MIQLRFVPIQQWPGTPTQDRRHAPFRSTYVKTLDLLETELKKLNAREIVVQAFLGWDQIRNDGWPRANERPQNPGVVLTFEKPDGWETRNGQKRAKMTTLSFPCDTYTAYEHNLHAIALSLEALRAVDRYGVTRRSEQYAGWRQIEAPKSAFESKEAAARFILQHAGDDLSVQAVEQVVSSAAYRQSRYREAARMRHPDNSQTGSHDLFVLLQQANTLLDAQ